LAVSIAYTEHTLVGNTIERTNETQNSQLRFAATRGNSLTIR
jgi:hypothetical protein